MLFYLCYNIYVRDRRVENSRGDKNMSKVVELSQLEVRSMFTEELQKLLNKGYVFVGFCDTLYRFPTVIRLQNVATGKEIALVIRITSERVNLQKYEIGTLRVVCGSIQKNTFKPIKDKSYYGYYKELGLHYFIEE